MVSIAKTAVTLSPASDIRQCQNSIVFLSYGHPTFLVDFQQKIHVAENKV